MYKRILIPLDGSPLAEQALPHAIVHAKHFRAELILLRVLVPLSRSHGMSEGALQRAEESTAVLATEYLERISAGIREQDLPVQVVTTEGRPHLEITGYVDDNQVDLIVMSTRGQSGFSRWLMGSVADRVVRGVSVPVLLVRTQEMELQGSQHPANVSA